jgi:hydrogenase nickel incorporation protein HypA/HybF
LLTAAMHEMSITRSVVAIVSERAVGQKITRIRLEIGALSAVMPDAIRFCFGVCSADTPAAGAELQIVEIPGLGCCNECGAEVPLETLVGRCPRCGTSSLRLIAGQELNIKEIEVQPCA